MYTAFDDAVTKAMRACPVHGYAVLLLDLASELGREIHRDTGRAGGWTLWTGEVLPGVPTAVVLSPVLPVQRHVPHRMPSQPYGQVWIVKQIGAEVRAEVVPVEFDEEEITS